MRRRPKPGDRVSWFVHGGATAHGVVEDVDGDYAIVSGDRPGDSGRVSWRRLTDENECSRYSGHVIHHHHGQGTQQPRNCESGRLSWRVLMAGLGGFSVGNLPDAGVVWTSIKLAFAVVLVVLLIWVARVEQEAV